MSKSKAWTSEEVKELRKSVRKEGSISAGCKVFAEASGERSEGASVVKYYSLTKRKAPKKRTYKRTVKAETPAERLNIAKGLTFDIQNIKRATLNGNNTLTLFF